jgi:hypothetical protein
MSTNELAPELDRDPETVYSGLREGNLSSAYLDEQGELQRNFTPEVFVNEDSHLEYPLNAQRELAGTHSESHFEWGYTGSGPRLLSVSLLADAYDEDELAVEYGNEFKNGVVADLDRTEDFQLQAKDIDDFIQELD